MERKDLWERVWLHLRTLAMIVVIEVMNEFGDHLIFTHYSLNMTSFDSHVLKVAVAFGLAVPFILFWLYRDYKRLTKTQNTLHESQQDYHSLFEHNPDGVYLLDYNGNFIRANPTFLKMTGFTLEELQQLSPLPFMSNENHNLVITKFQHALSGYPERYEGIFHTKQGERLDVDVSYFPMYRQGKVRGVYAIAQDITDRKRTEQALLQAQNMLSSFIDNTSDSIVIFGLDGKVLRVNAGFENLYGWKAHEVLGREIPNIAPPAELEDLHDMVQAVTRHQVISSRETIRLTKDGKAVDVNTTLSPIKNFAGNVTALVGVTRDISQHKQLRREVEESHARLHSLIEHTADAISIVDSEGRVLLVNPAWEQLYGWRYHEVIGRPSPLLTYKFDEAIHGRVISAVTETKHRRDGSDVTISVTASPIYSANDEIIGVAHISKDLTDMKNTEEALMNAEKLRIIAELAAGIAHEIRNPLTSIQGFIDLLKTHYNPTYLDILSQEVRRINEVTNEFMILAKPQARAQSYEKIAVIFDEVLTLMETQTNMHSISIHKRIETDLPSVFCVKTHIKQALINLLKNSVEALPEGGNIYIAVDGQENGLRMRLTDDGPGMDRDVLNRIGQPFYTTKDRGTGLGLMVTYRIVQNHNGSIHVESEPNQGTTFEIILPFDNIELMSDASRQWDKGVSETG